MATVVLGCDTNDNDAVCLNTVADALRAAGYTVEVLSIGPTPFGNYDWFGASQGKIGVYLMAPSIVSVADAMSHQGFDKLVFGLRGDFPKGARGAIEPGFSTNPWYPDDDCSAVCNKYSGKTGKEINEMIQPRGCLVGAATFDELAKKVVEAVGGRYSGTSSQEGGQSNVSPLLTGDMTFEELVGEICKGLDLLFIIKRNTVHLTDYESIFAEAKYLRDNYSNSVKGEDIKLWQLEDQSFELEINHHGYYNTVYVEYSDGKVKESYDDLVQVFGEVAITYKDPKVDKTTAIMKAKAYLAAHLRDMEVYVKGTMLTEPDIEIGDIITFENPKTMRDEKRRAEGRDPEYLFVNGISTSWEGTEPILTDVECMMAPTSPDKLEVPTSGNGSGSNNVGGNLTGSTGVPELDNLIKQWTAGKSTPWDIASAIHEGLKPYIVYQGYPCTHHPTVESCWASKNLNCADTARLTTACMKAAGLDAQVAWASGHFWTVVNIDGKWIPSDLTSNSGMNSIRSFGELLHGYSSPSQFEGDNPHC